MPRAIGVINQHAAAETTTKGKGETMKNTFASGYDSEKPVTADVAQAIRTLHKLLRRDFGADFSYTIAGEGQILAASNYSSGRIVPVSFQEQNAARVSETA